MATVSNPYTFTISANKTVSCVISSAVPTTDTVLASFSCVVYDSSDEDVKQVTIPTGVNIIFIEYYAGGDGDDIGFYINDVFVCDYVKVTPGKTYTCALRISSYGNMTGTANIYYSQSINSKTPNDTIL